MTTRAELMLTDRFIDNLLLKRRGLHKGLNEQDILVRDEGVVQDDVL